MDRQRCKDQHKSSFLSINQADLGYVWERGEEMDDEGDRERTWSHGEG